MQNNGRQPGLLEQYAHLTNRRPGTRFGQRAGVGQKSTTGPAKQALRGTIKRIMADRGFGFIQADGQRLNLFFHRSSLQNLVFEELKEGDVVEFDVQRDQRRDRDHAVNIRPLSKSKPYTPPKPEPTRGSIFRGWQSISTGVDQGSLYRRRDTTGRGSSGISQPGRTR